MDAKQVAKDALSIEYQKEIASHLIEELKLSGDAITVNQGEIVFSLSMRQNSESILILVKTLIIELANSKAELWLQTLNIKHDAPLIPEH